MQICYVALAFRSPFHNQLFAYSDSKDAYQIGDCVEIPFGKQKMHGYILKIDNYAKDDIKTKEISAKKEGIPPLSEEVVAIILWLVETKFAYYFDAINLFLSPAAKLVQTKQINTREKQYIIEIKDDAVFSKNAKKQAYVYNALKQEVLPLDFDEAKKRYGRTYVASLVEKGYVIIGEKEMNVAPIEKASITLNMQQEAILKSLKKSDSYCVHLIQGATGSGKTEVYLHYLETIINQGQQAIVLVPEIALTYQTRQLFEQRFGSERVVFMHSQLTQKERATNWELIASEKASIIIGTRTAIFSPIQNLGAIIIDEEHDAAYKQESQPVYHVRDIAMIRAKLNDVPLILLSATPSIESYAQAMVDKYEKHILTKQATGQKHAHIEIVDMKQDDARYDGRMISQKLCDEMKLRFEKNEQVILLLNKRGYSQSIQCRNCGEVEVCPKCGVALVLHKNPSRFSCHYCDFKKPDHGNCHHCKSTLRVDLAQGIQRLEEEVLQLFPEQNVLRLDRDTTKKRGTMEEILLQFERQEASVLIGTQMIAKGFDFPKVTLAAAVNADAGLNVPNFRARERQYQLLKQLIGRTGRHQEGLALIQTYQAENPFFNQLISEDDQFYKEELAIRKIYGYPPYKKQLLVSVYSKNQDQLIRCLRFIEVLMRKELKQSEVLGPTRGYLNEIKGHYYGHITLKYTKKEHLQIVKQILEQTIAKKFNTQIVINVDPYQTN